MGVERRRAHAFRSAATACAAWLYPAAGGDGRRADRRHGARPLGDAARPASGPFAERFAAAGIAALVFDHRGFGDSGGEPDLFHPARQLEDWRAAIALRPLAARHRSRSGRHLRLLDGRRQRARRRRGRPANRGGGEPGPLHRHPAPGAPLAARVTARALLAAARGRHLPAVGQPDEAALINAPGGEEGWRHVVAIGEDSRWRNRVSARWLLGRPYRPARHAAKLHCPWLVCVGEADRVAKPGPAIAAARRAPHGELRTYPGVDHFDIYDGPEHEAVVADEIEFLRRHLAA